MGGPGARSYVHARRTNAVRPESSLTMPAEMVRAVAVLVTGLPRSFQVVAVPVPEALPGDGAISYEVLPSGGATILGSQSGRIPPGRSRRQPLLFTVPVPASSRAGATQVAMVRFQAPGAGMVEVPIVMEVALVQRLELVADEALRAVRPGDGFALRFHLANLGNAPDTAEVRVVTPPGWRLQQPAPAELATIPLEVHAVAERVVTIRVPPGSFTGSASVRLIALVHGRPVATTDVPVLVLDPGFASSRDGLGPQLTLGAGLVAGTWGSPLTAYSATLDGRLTDDIRVSGRTTVVPDRRAEGVYARSCAVLLLMPPPPLRCGAGA